MKSLTINNRSFSFKTLQAVFVLLVAGLVGLNGCDSSSTGTDEEVKLNVEPGQYKMEISASLPGVPSGKAAFGSAYWENIEAQVFGIQFLSVFTDQGADQDTFALSVVRKSGRVDPGTYSFVNVPKGQTNFNELISSQKFLLFGLNVKIATPEGTEGYAVVSQSGTLTILKSTPNRVSGTISVKVSGVIYTKNGEQPVSGTYEGEFIAIPRSAN